MKSARFFVTLLLIGGLIFVVSSSAMAKNRFALEKETITKIVQESLHGQGLTSDGYTEIVSKVKLRNSSDKPLTFDVTVTFVNVEKETLGEATKTCSIKSGDTKVVSSMMLLDPVLASQIDAGYVTVRNAADTEGIETHSISASVNDSLKDEIAFVADRYVKVDYNVTLRNKSNKPVTSDLTVAFLDKDNVKIGEAQTTGSFEAGELKTISDTVVLRTSDASRIATSKVTIQKM